MCLKDKNGSAGDNHLVIGQALEQESAFAVVRVPVELDEQRLLVGLQAPLVVGPVGLPQGVRAQRQHSHVRTELLDQCLCEVKD